MVTGLTRTDLRALLNQIDPITRRGRCPPDAYYGAPASLL